MRCRLLLSILVGFLCSVTGVDDAVADIVSKDEIAIKSEKQPKTAISDTSASPSKSLSPATGDPYKNKTLTKGYDLKLSKEACNLIKSDSGSGHITPVTGAEYKPGVDVRGKPVVSADLNGRPNILPTRISVPITVPLTALGLPEDFMPGNEASVGTLSYEEGIWRLEDKILPGSSKEKLKELCAAAEHEKAE